VELVAIEREDSGKIYKRYYYLVKLTDSFTIKTSLVVCSIPKNKGWTLFVKSAQTIDSLKFESKRLQMEEFLNVKDVVFYNAYNMSDWKWYGGFVKKRDTMTLHVFKDKKEYIIPYYFYVKDPLETYPYSY
jgi:hypothetical protein